jgi:hypothetical protein
VSTASFSFKSNASDRELAFLDPRPDYFVVELRGFGVRAIREVYAYTDALGLSKLFGRLAEYSRPWNGAEKWESLEGEFSLAASCSAVGAVTFAVSIRDLLGSPEEWMVKASLITEMGQLPSIAANARSFFSGVSPPNKSLERTREG